MTRLAGNTAIYKTSHLPVRRSAPVNLLQRVTINRVRPSSSFRDSAAPVFLFGSIGVAAGHCAWRLPVPAKSLVKGLLSGLLSQGSFSPTPWPMSASLDSIFSAIVGGSIPDHQQLLS